MRENGCFSDQNYKIATPTLESCSIGADERVASVRAIRAASPDAESCKWDGTSEHACCVGSGFGEEIPSVAKNNGKVGTDHLDIEKGSLMVEHVVLDVQRLTCVGCETKLSRARLDNDMNGE